MSPPDAIQVELDVVPVSINRQTHEHWRSRSHRRARERRAVQEALAGRIRPVGPWTVTWTRLASRTLDTDNLSYSFKTCRDECARFLGVDDSDLAIVWEYRQELRREPARSRVTKMGTIRPTTRWRVWCRLEIRSRDEQAKV